MIAPAPRRGIISRLTDIINGPFRYRAGPSTLGIGAENMALVNPGIPADLNFYGSRYTPGRSMDIRAPLIQQEAQSLPSGDIRGNGVYIPGEYDLAGLTESEQLKG